MNDERKSAEVRDFGFRVPRFRTNFNFSLQVNSTREQHEASCTDISEEGLAADLLQSLAPETRVTLWLLFPGSVAPVQIQAYVEYRQERRHGFNFLYTSMEERSQVQAFIQSVRPKTVYMRGQI